MLDLILVFVVLIWLIFASICDMKTTEVPNWISFSLIAFGSFIVLVNMVEKNSFNPLIIPGISFLAALAISLLLYYTKQWGGGDAKLLMGLGIVFAVYPKSLLTYFNPNLDLPLFAIFLINTILAGVVYSIVYSFFLIQKNLKDFKPEFHKGAKRFTLLRIISLTLAVIFVLLWIVLDQLYLLFVALLSCMVVIFIYLTALTKSIEKVCMVVNIPPNKLQEGDWILKDVKKDNKIIYSHKEFGVSKEQIKELKHHNIKEVTIKKGIPFVPSFLLGAILTYTLGNIVTVLLKFFI